MENEIQAETWRQEYSQMRHALYFYANRDIYDSGAAEEDYGELARQALNYDGTLDVLNWLEEKELSGTLCPRCEVKGVNSPFQFSHLEDGSVEL